MIRTSVDDLDAAFSIVDQIAATRLIVAPFTAARALNIGRPLMGSNQLRPLSNQITLFGTIGAHVKQCQNLSCSRSS